MTMQDQELLQRALAWVAQACGPYELISDGTKDHPGRRSITSRLRLASGGCYLKIHRDPSLWAADVHGHQHWAPAFHSFAPRLLAVRDQEPLALLFSELPGLPLEQVSLSRPRQRAVWRSAGQALAGLHALEVGAFFGPCNRDGSCPGEPVADAIAYLASEMDHWLELGERLGAFSPEERSILRSAGALLPAFDGERPLPCHRDYCPANWLVDERGRWSGIIDFEFSRWDVRCADFTRYPAWEWMDRPDLIAAFFEGYGRPRSPAEEQQILYGYVLYAAAAVAWGIDTSYAGFAAEGRLALKRLGERL